MAETHEPSSLRGTSNVLKPSYRAGTEARKEESPGEPSKLPYRQYFLVLNPASGSADCDRLEAYARQKAAALGKSIVFHRLRRDESLHSVLDEAQDAEVIAAAGGDGTLASVATEAVNRGKVFAAIPCGTANVFAAEHGIPKKMEDAVDLMLERGTVQPVDLLAVGEKAFLCHISIGTYSLITTNTPTRYKKMFGRVAYIWNTIRIMLTERIWTFELEIDGKRMVRRASTIMVANAGSMGASGLRWGENIDSADGIVEICVIRARSFKHYAALFWAFLRKKPHKHLKEYFYVTREAVIRGPDDIPIRADGEKIGNGSFHVRVRKHGINVIVPQALH